MSSLLEKMPDALTVAQVRQVVPMGRRQAYERIATGEIPSFRLERRVLVRKEALRAWLDSRPSGSRAEQ